MVGHAGQTASIWMRTCEMPHRVQLQGDVETDVCVIGAGVAGLSVAYELVQRNLAVVVIDDGPIAGGETERTTAHLACAFDDGYVEMERLHGLAGARLIAESHAAAIDRIEDIVLREGIECGFTRVDGYLWSAQGSDGKAELEAELRAAHRAGLLGVERLEKVPALSFRTGPCLRYPRQGQVDPLRYLRGLIEAIEVRGGKIHTGTHAEHIEGGEPARVRTSTGALITASHVVVATNTPVNDTFSMHTKQAAYRTYVVGIRVPHGAVPRALYWDTADPYHYVRLTDDDEVKERVHGTPPTEILVVGGEDHHTGHADDAAVRFARLEAWARQRFPCSEVAYRWSGQVMEPFDGVGFIGRNPLDADNVYIATGDSGQGMTHGTIAGMLIPDLITGRDNPWQELYDPRRRTLSAAGEYARENLNIVSHYADWVLPGDVKSADEIQPGEGAVLRRGLRMLAVYRDEQGGLHERSAVCPHLGGIVTWNSTERTWDCPVHGSRYDAYGNVVNGPANRGLERPDGSRGGGRSRWYDPRTYRSPPR